MGISRSTLRWAPVIAEEAARAGMPYGCLLRLVERESGGVAGRVAIVGSPSGHAAGLCQVTPIALEEYNRLNPGAGIPLASMMGMDAASARIQLRVGSFLWMVGAHRWATMAPDRYQCAVLADLQYARGGGALRKLVEEAGAAGYPATLDGLRSFRPEWGSPERPFSHAEFVAGGIDDPGPGPIPAVEPSTTTLIGIGVIAGLGLLLLLIGWIR